MSGPPCMKVVAKRPPTEAVLLTLWSLWFRWSVAGGAVKVSGIPGLDDRKALRRAVHLYVPVIFVRRRNQGYAGLSATRTPKIFNPIVAGGHP